MAKCTPSKPEKMERSEPKKEVRNTVPEKKEYKQMLSILPKKK